MGVLDRLSAPIVQAPLAGGPSTPELAAAVSGAGGLGFLAAGYKSAEALAAEMDAMGGATYGVNLFVPGDGPADPDAVQRYAARLRDEGHEPGEGRYEDDGWEAKLNLLGERAPAVVSFTFGCPDEATVTTLRDAGCEVWVTVTGPEEARIAQWAGAAVLVAQGIEAGGHRASFADQGDLGLLALLALLGGPDSQLPIVASGGIASAATVAAVLAAGAKAAQVGTAFMRCPEAGTSPAQRDAIASPGLTRVTTAFTGKPARGIENRFMREHPDAPAAYPEVHHLTAPVRAAGRERGDREVVNLWAGQAHELAREVPAAQVVAELSALA